MKTVLVRKGVYILSVTLGIKCALYSSSRIGKCGVVYDNIAVVQIVGKKVKGKKK